MFKILGCTIAVPHSGQNLVYTGWGVAIGAFGYGYHFGAVKVLLALAAIPRERRAPLIDSAIKAGTDFIFSIDPATADYPHPYSLKPSEKWWKFGFPGFYVTDLLQLVEAMARLSCGQDPRLANAIHIIQDKRDSTGRWKLEYDYQGKIKVDFGEKNKPSKWVTLRTLRALETVGC